MCEKIHGGDIYANDVDLDFSVNIHPLGMPKAVEAALLKAVEDCTKYPDISAGKLKTAVSKMLHVPAEYLLFGNGASELLMAAVHGIRPQKTVIPVPSFYGYEYAVKSFMGEVLYIEMKEEDGFGVGKNFLSAVTDDVDLVFLANPNNPTGKLMSRQEIEMVAEHCAHRGTWILLDECFIDFCGSGHSMISELERYPNLIIVRAFTKIFSIPGVRLGYMISSNEGLTQRIRRNLPEWNLSCFAQAAGYECAMQSEYMENTAAYIKTEREFLNDGLKRIGIRTYEGEANFILIYSELPLYEELLKKKILIRDCENFRGLSKGFYRIAVRNRKENEILLKAVEEISGKINHTKKTNKIEKLLPEEIEKRSFEMITKELGARGICLPKEQEPVTIRVIHTSADFDYAHTMIYSEGAVGIAKELLMNGADIVTDTNMALAGINKKVLERLGGSAYCFMADEDIAAKAKEEGMTRAAASMEKAGEIKKPVIFAIGNAPTALIMLYEMIKAGKFKPALIIGVPVGFVNVEAAKELIMETDVPYMINRGRKGGSNIAAAICNALLYEAQGAQARG